MMSLKNPPQIRRAKKWELELQRTETLGLKQAIIKLKERAEACVLGIQHLGTGRRAAITKTEKYSTRPRERGSNRAARIIKRNEYIAAARRSCRREREGRCNTRGGTKAVPATKSGGRLPYQQEAWRSEVEGVEKAGLVRGRQDRCESVTPDLKGLSKSNVKASWDRKEITGKAQKEKGAI